MLKRISKVLLLVALLTAFVASSAPAFTQGSITCACYTPVCYPGHCKSTGKCKFDATASPLQCVNQNCTTYCYETVP